MVQSFKLGSLILLILCIGLAILPIVQSAPTKWLSSTGGLEISYPTPEVLAKNANLFVRFWVYNVTNGNLMTNVTTNCTYNLLNDQGKNVLIVASPAQIKYGGLEANDCASCFNFEIEANNFSETGEYLYQIRCQSATLGGYVYGGFEVTPNGLYLTFSDAIIYCLIYVVTLLIFLGLLTLGIMIDGKNKTDQMTGYVLAVSNMKYVKLLCFAFAYLAFIVLMYFSWLICFSFLDMPFMGNIFQFIFYASAYATLPFFIIGVFIVISNTIQDTKLDELLSRGVEFK